VDDFEACIAHLRLPIAHRRATRTTNLLERLLVEERRRLKIIPNAFGEKAVLSAPPRPSRAILTGVTISCSTSTSTATTAPGSGRATKPAGPGWTAP
jgi:hypothetical protein